MAIALQAGARRPARAWGFTLAEHQAMEKRISIQASSIEPLDNYSFS